LRQCIEEVS